MPAAGDPAQPGRRRDCGGGDAGEQAKKTGRHRRLGRCRSEDQDVPRAIFRHHPDTLDIMMAQEDLWVYETLLKVIRNTNDFGTDPKHRPEELPETGQPQSGPHQANPGDGHRQGRRRELEQVREGPVQSARRERQRRASDKPTAARSAPGTAKAAARGPLRTRAVPRWQAAMSTTRASPWRTPRSSLTANSA